MSVEPLYVGVRDGSLLSLIEGEASERGDPTALGLAILVKTHMFVATLLVMFWLSLTSCLSFCRSEK